MVDYSVCGVKGSLGVSNVRMGFRFILVEGIWKEEVCQVAIANVYSPCDLVKKMRV